MADCFSWFQYVRLPPPFLTPAPPRLRRVGWVIGWRQAGGVLDVSLVLPWMAIVPNANFGDLTDELLHPAKKLRNRLHLHRHHIVPGTRLGS